MTVEMQNKIRNISFVIALAYVAFIALGMPDGLLGVGWPSIRAGFNQPLDALGMLLVASVIGYTISSFLNGKLLGKMGVGGLLAASCGLTGAALIGYTFVPQWWMMAALGLVAGLGAGGIDAGLNTYVATHFSERVMQWLHASYGIGVTLGPLIMTGALNLFGSWRLGYRIVGAAQILLAAVFVFTLKIWKNGHTSPEHAQQIKLTDYKTPYLETFKQPRVWLSLLMFFLYTGSEVTLGTWAYSLLTEARHVSPGIAGFIAGSYWLMFTIGRILAGFFTRKVGTKRLVRISLIGAVSGAVLVWWNPLPVFSIIGVGLIGFAIAPIFPGLVSGTRDRVGERFAANTIGMQMSAAGLGAAAVPSLVGVLAERTSLEAIPICLAVFFTTLILLHTLSGRTKEAAFTAR